MSALTLAGFNPEQVRPFLPAFREVRAEIEAAGQYPYNESFVGRVPGIEGPSEGRAIYLLQTLHDLDLLAQRVDAFLADGGEEVTEIHEERRGTVVHVGFYMGGTGWHEWQAARLVPRDGRPHAVLPKGRRTHGHLLLGGRVLWRAS